MQPRPPSRLVLQFKHQRGFFANLMACNDVLLSEVPSRHTLPEVKEQNVMGDGEKEIAGQTSIPEKLVMGKVPVGNILIGRVPGILNGCTMTSGGGPVHACVPIHAHPQFPQRFVIFHRIAVYHDIDNYQIDHTHW